MRARASRKLQTLDGDDLAERRARVGKRPYTPNMAVADEHPPPFMSYSGLVAHTVWQVDQYRSSIGDMLRTRK